MNGVRKLLLIIGLAALATLFLTLRGTKSELTRSDTASDAAFCAVLTDIRTPANQHANVKNELFGHSDYIRRLYEVAPDAIADDLEQIYEILAATRDSKGTGTLLAFQKLTDTELAGYEGRVAQYVENTCGVADGDTSFATDPDFEPVGVCPAWPSAGSPLTNNRFPYLLDTSSANYFSMILLSAPFGKTKDGMLNVPRGGKVTISGQFPYAKYFGFHPNDMATNNLKTLTDVNIEPDDGSINPWRQAQEGNEGRRYTVHLIVDEEPADPAPNTSYVGYKKNGGKNYATFLIYRIYGADLPSLPPNSAGVLLPAVTIFDKDGDQVAHYPECNPYPPGSQPPVDGTKMPAFPVPDHRAQSRAGRFEEMGNFGLDVDILANADVTYLTSYFGRDHGEVFAIRAKKPKTVDPSQNRTPWSGDLDLRMWTACTYNFWNGAANDCVVDNDIPADEHGFYTIIITEPDLRPKNAVKANAVTWMNAGNFLDGQISLRLLPKTAPFLTQLTSDIAAGTASPYIPETAFCSKTVFEKGGFDACKAEDQE